MKHLFNHLATELLSDAKPVAGGALQQRVRRLLRRTAFKLAKNEFQEWGKLMTVRQAAPLAATSLKPGRKLNPDVVKKTAIVAAAVGIGYYLLTRR